MKRNTTKDTNVNGLTPDSPKDENDVPVNLQTDDAIITWIDDNNVTLDSDSLMHVLGQLNVHPERCQDIAYQYETSHMSPLCGCNKHAMHHEHMTRSISFQHDITGQLGTYNIETFIDLGDGGTFIVHISESGERAIIARFNDVDTFTQRFETIDGLLYLIVDFVIGYVA